MSHHLTHVLLCRTIPVVLNTVVEFFGVAASGIWAGIRIQHRMKALLTSLSINIGARKLIGTLFAIHYIRKLFGSGHVDKRVEYAIAARDRAIKTVAAMNFTSTCTCMCLFHAWGDYSTDFSCCDNSMREKDWRSHARVTPARLPWQAHITCVPRLLQRQSFFNHTLLQFNINIGRILTHTGKRGHVVDLLLT